MRSAVVLALATALAGCSIVNDPAHHQGGGIDGGVDAAADDAGPPDAGPSVSADEFCDALNELVCRAHFGCCLERAPEANELETCMGVIDCGRIIDVPLREMLHDDRVAYDPHVAAQVLAEAEDRIARCDLTIQEWYGRRDGLWRMLPGTIEPGGSCAPRRSDPFDYAVVFACEGFDRRCLPSDSATWTCAVRGSQGQRCINTTDCRPGLYCRDPLFLAGQCDDRQDDGTLCQSDDACESFHCPVTAPRICRPARTAQDVYCML